MIENLEEETLTDTDYCTNRATLDLLKEKGLEQNLAGLIQGAVGESDDVEIRYERAQDKSHAAKEVQRWA